MRLIAGRSRLLIRRIVTGAALLAGGMLLITVLGGRRDDDIEAIAPADERGYYLTDSTLTEMGPDGRPRIVVHAKNIEQRVADDSVLLAQLEMDYTAGKTGVWHVTADRGRMPPGRESLLLAGNVRVTGEPAGAKEDAVIVTDELSYDTRTNVVQTAAPVAVHFGTHQLLGRGMRVQLNDGTLRLESNVNGLFTP
jgi:LPS export ABC transporter protein LptC